ncbi:MAG: hypothetical protein CO170_00160 [candidate division SR1 bacterium CG_4_9_14_3_um_filter_40_9]|nr:MAG: hypothetical protein CO170_00160 [candidate division SR1 bacterium CG_4_9_14_3_um_filter_40_9]
MYSIGFFITEPIGNNEFSHAERIVLGSEGKIYIPPLIKGTVNDLEIGTEIAFEEVRDGKLISCKGLKNLICTDYKGILTYIVDNHDHAMFFWHQHIHQFPTNEGAKPFKVIHIDQHSDIKEVTHGEYNVGNFITHALSSKLIDECIQIRTEIALHSLPKLDFADYNYILDIDVDFREGKTDKEIEADTEIIQRLMQDSCLITIATSPYFFDQNKAIAIVKRLLS